MINATLVRDLLVRHGEELRLHIDLCKTSDTARELEKRLYALKDAHVGEADFLGNKSAVLAQLDSNGDGVRENEVATRMLYIP